MHHLTYEQKSIELRRIVAAIVQYLPDWTLEPPVGDKFRDEAWIYLRGAGGMRLHVRADWRAQRLAVSGEFPHSQVTTEQFGPRYGDRPSACVSMLRPAALVAGCLAFSRSSDAGKSWVPRRARPSH